MDLLLVLGTLEFISSTELNKVLHKGIYFILLNLRSPYLACSGYQIAQCTYEIEVYWVHCDKHGREYGHGSQYKDTVGNLFLLFSECNLVLYHSPFPFLPKGTQLLKIHLLMLEIYAFFLNKESLSLHLTDSNPTNYTKQKYHHSSHLSQSFLNFNVHTSRLCSSYDRYS